MLAYYVEWHMRDALRELIFDDDEIAGAQALRKSVVAKAQHGIFFSKRHDADSSKKHWVPLRIFV